MEQTKRMASHLSLVDLSETKEGQVLDIVAYQRVPLHDDDEYMDVDLSFAASSDDRPKFVALMKSLYEERPLPEGLNSVKFCPGDVFYTVLYRNSVNCLTALLEGETDTIVFINTPFGNGWYPLHVLAANLSYKLIDLFLKLGARTNVRTISSDSYYEAGRLPLNSSLDALSYEVCRLGWTPEQSIFKLIFVLCLPSMKQPLQVNRLLACNTEDVEVEEILIHYAINAKHIQMAALLIVAWEKVMPSSLMLHSTVGSSSSSSSSLGGIMKVRQFILEEIKVLADKEAKLMDEKKYSEFEHKRAVMMSVLVLLEVFERVGDYIATFMHGVLQSSQFVPKEKVLELIKLLLGCAGVVLKDEDVDLRDIDCGSTPTIKLETEILGDDDNSGSSPTIKRETEILGDDDNSGSTPTIKLETEILGDDDNSGSNPTIKRETEILEKQTVSMSQLQDRCMPLHSTFGRHCPEKKAITNITPAPKSYHTFRYLEGEFVPPFPSLMQLRVKRTMGVKEPFPQVLSSKKFLSIALAIKRGIMRI